MEEKEAPGTKPRRAHVTVREMEIDDLPHVFHLGEKLFTAKIFPTLYRTWDEYEVTNLFQSDSEHCLIAEAEGRVAGFVLGTIITKPRSAWKYGYLLWMGVEPEYHRRGVAERLFSHFKEKMVKEGVGIIIVDTESDNLAALHFFRKMGFGAPREHIYLSLNLKSKR